MGTRTSFEQILRGKMSGTEAEAPAAHNPEPAHLAYMLGQIPVYRFRTMARPKSQASLATDLVQDTPKAQEAQPEPAAPLRPQRVSGPAHVLTERQKTATQFFMSEGEALLPDFTAEELKKAFRRLARRLHPDATGTTDSTKFLELKKQNQELSVLFK